MLDVKFERDHYQAEFEAFAAHRALAHEPAWLLGLRKDAMAFLAERGFPTSRDEEWKYTSVAPVTRTPFRLAEPAELTGRELAAEGVDLWDGPQLVFVNGVFVPELSTPGADSAGIRVSPISQALRDRGDDTVLLARELAQPIVEPHGFTALATAFFTDGALVIVDRGTIAPRPVHLVFVGVGAGQPALSAVRNVVVAGESSQCTVVETYLTVGPGKPSLLTDALTRISLADNAVVDHYRVQREGGGSIHISSQQLHLARDASLRTGTYTLGGALVRNDVAAVLDGEGAECRLLGLYVASGDQKIDNRTVVDHARPHGTSHETYKGIVDGSAVGTFNGKIVVREGAAKTDAHQSNRNLQLSRTATVNTKPQLEIYNDDVKCSHGATIGQLDADALFYLRSRGLGLAEARALLTFAFGSELVAPIKVPAVRAAISEFLLEKLPGSAALGGRE